MVRLILAVIILLILLFAFLNLKDSRNTFKRGGQAFPLTIDSTDDARGLGYTGQKKLAQDSKGNLYLTYRKKFNGKHEIYVAKIAKNNGKWEAKTNSEPVSKVLGETDQRVPSIVIDKNDRIHLVWYGADQKEKNGDRQIKYASSSDYGESWSKWQNISYVEGYRDERLWQEHPDIATVNNNLYVVWEGKDKEHKNQQIKLSKSGNQGQTWTRWANILPTERTQSRPTIVADLRGNLHIFMYSAGNGDNQQIWHTTSADGTVFNAWENVSQTGLDSRHATAIVDNWNRIIVVWRSALGEESAFLEYSVYEGSKWSSPAKIADSSNNQFFPTIGRDINNNIYVSWFETEAESNIPNDNPTGGKIYTSILFSEKNTFSQKRTEEYLSNALYPSFLPQNGTLGNFLAYLKEGEKFNIELAFFD